MVRRDMGAELEHNLGAAGDRDRAGVTVPRAAVDERVDVCAVGGGEGGHASRRERLSPAAEQRSERQLRSGPHEHHPGGAQGDEGAVAAGGHDPSLRVSHGAAVSCVGAGLHGRPGIVGWLVGVMLIELAVLGWSATRLVRGMDGPFSFALIAIVACYRGLVGISVLWRGYVLLAVPPLLGRAAVAVCLAGGITLALAVIRLVDQERSARPGRRLAA
jgi:hypothetical protein